MFLTQKNFLCDNHVILVQGFLQVLDAQFGALSPEDACKFVQRVQLNFPQQPRTVTKDIPAVLSGLGRTYVCNILTCFK
jgi:hypothetical protein